MMRRGMGVHGAEGGGLLCWLSRGRLIWQGRGMERRWEAFGVGEDCGEEG